LITVKTRVDYGMIGILVRVNNYRCPHGSALESNTLTMLILCVNT